MPGGLQYSMTMSLHCQQQAVSELLAGTSLMARKYFEITHLQQSAVVAQIHISHLPTDLLTVSLTLLVSIR
jgi:hypothetical protein